LGKRTSLREGRMQRGSGRLVGMKTSRRCFEEK
jgi:hypothetical protein